MLLANYQFTDGLLQFDMLMKIEQQALTRRFFYLCFLPHEQFFLNANIVLRM